MATFRVKREHREAGAPDHLVEAFRVGPHQSHRYRAMPSLDTGVTRLPSDGDWVVSEPNEEPCHMRHETFLSNYEAAN